MHDDRPYLLPQPKTLEPCDGHFVLNADTIIALLPGADAAVTRAARSLQEEITADTSLRPPLVVTARPARTTNLIVLTDDPTAARAWLPEATLPQADLAARGTQAYAVRIRPERVVAGGNGSAAAHHAAQTLRQLVRTGGTRLPSLDIMDWPSLPFRGVMMDVCRGKVPTMVTLKRVVDELSLYKMNVLQLYTEHTFAFPHHPLIGAGCGSLTADDMLELDAYARAQQVELQPNLQSFGHMHHILSIPAYQHLAEASIRWSLDVTNEDSYRLLDDLYGDMLPAFRSAWFNVGCDETWDLGKGHSAARAAEIGVGRVYLEHILRLRELAARHGRRIQIWGDILLHQPELVPELPDDVLLLDWHYEAEEDYPSVRVFADSGRDYWVCPGTSAWNTLWPRIENSNANIRTLARLAAENGGQGLLNTDWGDHGHYEPIGQSWYGYLYGAEQAWSGGRTADAEFDRNLGPLFFGQCGVSVVAAMRALGRLNALEGMPLRNATRSIYALLDEPLVGEAAAALPQETLRTVERGSREAEATFRDGIASAPHAQDLEDMAFSARLLAFAARKTLAMQGVRADVDALAAGQLRPEDTLPGDIATVRALEGELITLTERFRGVWLARARHSEIGISLGHLDGVRARMAAAAGWLEERLADSEAGQQPDYSLADYAACADYMVLGQRFSRRWRDLGLR